jgi:regulator of replication initiation timing
MDKAVEEIIREALKVIYPNSVDPMRYSVKPMRDGILKAILLERQRLREEVDKVGEELQTKNIEDDGLDVETEDYWIRVKELKTALAQIFKEDSS